MCNLLCLKINVIILETVWDDLSSNSIHLSVSPRSRVDLGKLQIRKSSPSRWRDVAKCTKSRISGTQYFSQLVFSSFVIFLWYNMIMKLMPYGKPQWKHLSRSHGNRIWAALRTIRR